MPADLTNPFGPSCCDGGACSEADRSARPCGCDPGAGYVSAECAAAHRCRTAEPQSVSRFACGLMLEDEDDAQ